MQAPSLKVYWRPGCSSCVRVKEFLTGLGIDYESINISARPEAMDELRGLGVRTVPVVSRGRDYVFAQELADVEDIRDFGASVTARVRRWWAAVPDKSCSEMVQAYYGLQPLHHLLERCTWHSAQHAGLRRPADACWPLGVRAKQSARPLA